MFNLLDYLLQKGRGGGRSSGGSYNQSSNNSRSWDPEVTESSIAVPAGKCGVIIGKGKCINHRSNILFFKYMLSK